MVDGRPQVVGGAQIGPTPAEAMAEAGEDPIVRKRGRDGRKRSARTCQRCKAWGDIEQSKQCKGASRMGRTMCEWYDNDPPEDEDNLPEDREDREEYW